MHSFLAVSLLLSKEALLFYPRNTKYLCFPAWDSCQLSRLKSQLPFSHLSSPSAQLHLYYNHQKPPAPTSTKLAAPIHTKAKVLSSGPCRSQHSSVAMFYTRGLVTSELIHDTERSHPLISSFWSLHPELSLISSTL